jgi:hypothetical protein
MLVYFLVFCMILFAMTASLERRCYSFLFQRPLQKGCRGNRQEKRDEAKGEALYGQSNALCSVVAEELCPLCCESWPTL